MKSCYSFPHVMSGKNPGVSRQKSSVQILPVWAIFRAVCAWALRFCLLSQMAEFPFCGWIIFHSIFYIFPLLIHIFPLSIHLSKETGGFHVLTSVNDAAMNVGVDILFELDFFVGTQKSLQGNAFHFLQIYTPKVGLLSHMVVLILVSWGFSILSLLMAIQVHILIKGAPYSFSPHSHQHLFSLFDDNHSHRCDSSMCFRSAFSWWLVMLNIFHAPTVHLYVFFGKKTAYSIVCPFLIWLFGFYYWVIWAHYVFWILTPYQIHDWQVFSFPYLPFHSVYHFFCCAETF